jgi:drug/metabolite transporter (DMT)-like permease
MKRSNNPLLNAYLALAVGIGSLGVSAIFVRWANAPGVVTSFYRMAVAVLVMALPFYRRTRSRSRLPAKGIRLALAGGILFAGDVAFWATGVMIGGATNPTLLANTAPLWVGLGALILFREDLRASFWTGLILATAGAVFILGLDSLQSFEFGLGSLLGILAGIFYAGYFLVTQRGRQHLDSLSYFWLAALSSTAALLAISVVWRLPLSGYPAQTYLNFVALGLITQVVGYLAINYAIGYLPASIVSPTLLGQPVVTALLAGPLLGERLSLWQGMGGLAVLLGVYLVHRSRSGAGRQLPASA